MTGMSTNPLTVTFVNAGPTGFADGSAPTLQADVASGLINLFWMSDLHGLPPASTHGGPRLLSCSWSTFLVGHHGTKWENLGPADSQFTGVFCEFPRRVHGLYG